LRVESLNHQPQIHTIKPQLYSHQVCPEMIPGDGRQAISWFSLLVARIGFT
jgi:hypothetical protein